MGPESSGKYDVYMMVDGEPVPVKIPTDLPEISLGEHTEDLPEDSLSELAKSWEWELEITGIDPEKVAEAFRWFDEAMKIAEELAEKAAKVFTALFGSYEESMEELEEYGVFDYEQTARKKKREQDRRISAKMENAARFSQYGKRRLCWDVKRRTRPRARERAPPWACEPQYIGKKEQIGMKRKNPMPRYYGKNIARHAQKRFLQRKALEADLEKRRERPADAVDSGKKDN